MSPIPPPKQVLRTAASILMAACFIVPVLTCLAGDTQAATYVFDGATTSHVHVTSTTTIQVSGFTAANIANGSRIVYNATYPTSSGVSGYSASYSNVNIEASPAYSSVSGVMTDQFGNSYRQYVWSGSKITGAPFTITVTTSFDADLQGDLGTLSFDDPVGTSEYSEFRSSTAMVQSADPAIVNKKNALLSGVTSEAQAVDKIMNFVKTNIPNQNSGVTKDAVSSLNSNSGNCVNRAHLALALLRSAGIPARCVQGLLYGDAYTVSYPVGGGTGSTEVTWGSGSHVWVEVYYPQEGAWVAYDPWMDKGFVDSRHVRFAVGQDFDPKKPATRGYAGLIIVSNLGSSPSASTSTGVSASNLQDSFSLHYKYTELSPPSTFMMGRTMQSSLAPTPTPAPSATVRPNNTTVTPSPTMPPTATPAGHGGTDVPRYNLTGTIIDHGSGTPVAGATVMLDSIQLSASSSGKFVFLNALSSGLSNLTVSAPGYVTDVRAIVPNGADMDVTIILKPGNSSVASTSPGGPLPGPGVLAAAAALAGGALLWRKKRP